MKYTILILLLFFCNNVFSQTVVTRDTIPSENYGTIGVVLNLTTNLDSIISIRVEHYAVIESDTMLLMLAEYSFEQENPSAFYQISVLNDVNEVMMHLGFFSRSQFITKLVISRVGESAEEITII